MQPLHTPRLNRRSLLAGLASLPLLPKPTFAEAEMFGAARGRFDRFVLGEFEVTMLLAGSRLIEEPRGIFGANASDEDFKAASDAAHISMDRTRSFFTPCLVNTGAEVVLFDTGAEPMALTAALESAGYFVEDIDVVVLTHMHSDHIGGMMTPTGPTFPNARYVTGNVEFDAWDDTGDEAFTDNVLPIADRFDFVADGLDVAPGVTAVEAFGHTYGHMAYHIESKGARLLIASDFAIHPVWSLAHPDWEVAFDADAAQAAKTRRKMLDMLATDRVPFIGYHMPWPGLGFVDKFDGGYAYVPESYQLRT